MAGSGLARGVAGLVCLVLVLGALFTSKPEEAGGKPGAGNGNENGIETEAAPADPETDAIKDALQAALKDAATAQESWRTAHSSYTDDVNRLAKEGLQLVPQIQFTIVQADENGYCMNAAYPPAELFYFYWSENGAPLEGDCESAVP